VIDAVLEDHVCECADRGDVRRAVHQAARALLP
jgi:hypothetical protein